MLAFLGLLLLVLVRGLCLARRALHILQLEGYRTKRFLTWLLRRAREGAANQHLLALLFLVAVTAAAGWFPGARTPALVVGVLAWIAFEAAQTYQELTLPVRKPLVMTFRATRIYVTAIVCLTVLFVVVVGAPPALASRFTGAFQPTTATILVSFLLLASTPLVTAAATVSLLPLEALLRLRYRLSARRKLGSMHPKIIGITGSYGKTTTKHIIGAILGSRFNTLVTPHSYNTLLGVTRTIRENLTAKHEVFVVEMGAYGPGDIAELCHLVSPSIGVLTAIGPQHLERFGSLDAIEKTKAELPRSLPSGGLAVINVSDPRCARVADTITQCRVARVGIGADGRDFWIPPESIAYGAGGVSFDVSRRDGDAVPFSTKLLGRHNLTNILCAIAVAAEVGLDMPAIQRAVRRLEPFAHRLEPKQLANGVIVIDDSYNSNPVGAGSALEVLGMFGSVKKVLVTPGMVELGEREREDNEAFGRTAAGVCSAVILVGRSPACHVRDGLLAAGFPEASIRIVDRFTEAQTLLATMTGPGDVVLLENDLPDNY